MRSFALLSLFALVAAAPAQIRITEIMYNGGGGEFFEITNVGAAPISLAGYSYDDNSDTPGVVDISSLGTLAGFESAIVTELDADLFRTNWGLASTVKVFGLNATNLGGNDRVNIFSGAQLVDKLGYGTSSQAGFSQTFSPDISQNVPVAVLGLDQASNTVAAVIGDSFGSVNSSTTVASVGNPGQYTPVPEPASMAVLGLGVAVLKRRRKA